MTWIATAIVGSAIVGAVGSNLAANKQAGGQQAAANTQQSMFNTIQGNEQPFIKAGQGANSTLTDLLGTTGTPGSTVGNTGLQNGYLTQTFDPNSLNGNPAYNFALQTGAQATRNADTPGVGALSGAALKDLTNFDVGTANQYENQYYNQFQTNQNSIYSRLAGIAGLGQNAAGNLGNNGAQLGTGIAQAQAGAAASQAGGIVGATNALSGGGSNLAGLMYLNAGQSPSTGSVSGGVNSTGFNTSTGAPVNAGNDFGLGPGGKIGGPVYSGMKKFSGLKHMADGGPVDPNNPNGNFLAGLDQGSNPATPPPSQTPLAPGDFLAGMNQGGDSNYSADSNNPGNPVGGQVQQPPTTTPNFFSEQPGEVMLAAGQNGQPLSGPQTTPFGTPIGGIQTLNTTPAGQLPGQNMGYNGGLGAGMNGVGAAPAATAPAAAPAAAPASSVGAAPAGVPGVGGQTLNSIMNGGAPVGATNSLANSVYGGVYGGGATNPNDPSTLYPGLASGNGVVGGGAKDGGPIYGPGGPKSDDVPVMLSNGEHVWSADEVNALGGGNNAVGQQRMMRLRDMIKRGAR